MKILLISPEYPDTYWSFKHAIKFISKKTASPPLGLLTVAAMLPKEWDRQLIDMNVTSLRDSDLEWPDYVFISAMSVQESSADKVIERCQTLGKKVVAGGPHFTGNPEKYKHVDHLVLNEAEITLPGFLDDLEKGNPLEIYNTGEFTTLHNSPLPDYSLIDQSKYAQLCLQYSRGCPFNCEFCEITALLGRKVRTKTSEQILLELENIYNTGFRGNVFFVDDNFIGNRHKLKNDLLPVIIEWNNKHDHPFTFTTEASIDLSDDDKLMEMMAIAGFVKIFIGIETPDEGSLMECDKILNTNRDLIESVNLIQSRGMEVAAGFIVGFDSDSSGIFQRQIDFIQKSGIITAMVGLLNAPNRTRLYERLSGEGRIVKSSEGDNTNFSMNFIPRMDKDLLIKGYQNILRSIYSSKAYTERVIRFMRDYRPRVNTRPGLTMEKIIALLRSVFILGILNKSRIYYWRLFFWSLFKRPEMLPLAITYSIYGYHFRKVFGIES